MLGGGLTAGRSTSLNTPGTARPSILIHTQADQLEKLVRKVQLESFSVKDAATACRKERSRAARIIADLQKTGYLLSAEQRPTSEERDRPAAW